MQSLRDIPAGEYRVQPFVNVYTKFARADGHTVWLHMDQWEGQQWKTSPGNLYGDPVRITYLKTTTTPKHTGEIVFQPMAPHCWGPGLPELLGKMTTHIERTAPSGADVRSWRY